jgi:hypothetical protein
MLGLWITRELAHQRYATDREHPRRVMGKLVGKRSLPVQVSNTVLAMFRISEFN